VYVINVCLNDYLILDLQTAAIFLLRVVFPSDFRLFVKNTLFLKGYILLIFFLNLFFLAFGLTRAGDLFLYDLDLSVFDIQDQLRDVKLLILSSAAETPRQLDVELQDLKGPLDAPLGLLVLIKVQVTVTLLNKQKCEGLLLY
jgi:hypothetical protein